MIWERSTKGEEPKGRGKGAMVHSRGEAHQDWGKGMQVGGSYAGLKLRLKEAGLRVAHGGIWWGTIG
jgi:hypothetical protein